MLAGNCAFAIDLGLPAQYSALAMVERSQATADLEPVFTIHGLDRFPPQTPYRDMVARLRECLDKEFPGEQNPHPFRTVPVVIGVNGVGPKILSMFRDPEPFEINTSTAVLTAGLSDRCDERGIWQLPKGNLITQMQIALQERRLRIPPALVQAESLVTELKTYRPKPAVDKDETMLSWREGAKDDLLFAVALGIWRTLQVDFDAGADDAPSVGMRKGMGLRGLGPQANLKLSDIVDARVRRSRTITHPVADTFGNPDYLDRR